MHTTTTEPTTAIDFTAEATHASLHAWVDDGQSKAYTLLHLSGECAQYAEGTALDIDSKHNGWPCSTCWTDEEIGVSSAQRSINEELQNRPQGDGTGKWSNPPASNGPSEKQANYARRLVAEKLPEADADACLAAFATGRDMSRAIDALLELDTPTPASGAEVVGRWTKANGGWGIKAPGANTGDTITVRKASGEEQTHTLGAKIAADTFMAGQAAPATAPATGPKVDVEPGKVYRLTDGQMMLAVESKAGRVYGKVYNEQTSSFEYEGGAVQRVAREITADEAAEFGHLTGKCVFCRRALSDERSMKVGYGETCASNHGLPWGD